MTQFAQAGDRSLAATILLFTRAPVAGRVKTRLSPVLSDDDILLLHKALVAHALSQVVEANLGPVQLWVDQLVEHSFFQTLQQNYPQLQLREQQGGDLGERMANAMALGEEPPYILIGSDCPALSADYLRQAADALSDENPVVIGPAADGGYVLLASNLAVLPVFDGVHWGSDSVLEATRQALRAAGINWTELKTLRDIDRPEDLLEARAYHLLG